MFVDLSPTALHILCGHIHHVANLNVLGEEDAEACQRAAKALDFFGRLVAAEDKILDAAQRVHDAYCSGKGEVSVSEMAALERAIAAHGQQRSKLHLATVASAFTPLPAGQLAAAQAMGEALGAFPIADASLSGRLAEWWREYRWTWDAWVAATAAAPEGEPCTGMTANWCPIHGECSCPELPGGGRSMDDPRCMLHGVSSRHAEEPEPTPPAPPAAPSAALRDVRYSSLTEVRDRVGATQPKTSLPTTQAAAPTSVCGATVKRGPKSAQPCHLPIGHSGNHVGMCDLQWGPENTTESEPAPASGRTLSEEPTGVVLNTAHIKAYRRHLQQKADNGVQWAIDILDLCDIIEGAVDEDREARASGEGER